MTTLTGLETINVTGVIPSDATVVKSRGGVPTIGTFEATIQAIADLAAGGGSALRTISSGSSDVATVNDVLIAWNSATASAKSQTIPTGLQELIIVDEIGTAQTYNITITPASGTINNAASLVLNINNQSVTLVWSAATSNYMVI